MVILNAVVLSGVLVSLFISWLRGRSEGIGLGVLLVTIAVWVLLGLAMSMLVPHPGDISWSDLQPGAIVFDVGVYALHLVTVLHFGHKLAAASKLYGALGFAATLLLWAFLVCRLTVLATALNATWTSRSSLSASNRSA